MQKILFTLSKKVLNQKESKKKKLASKKSLHKFSIGNNIS